MKHFFFPYESKSVKNGILNDLFDNVVNSEKSNEDEKLKGIYDAVDTIYDKRLEEKDGELRALLKAENRDRSDAVSSMKRGNKERYELLSDYIDKDEKINSYRIRALIVLWKYVEDQYRTFISKDNCKKTTLILYHLVRGNICIRISEIYYENYDLEDSDMWGHKAIEILWHGKNLAANYRDELKRKSKNLGEADLYLRVIKLNLAKYYRDYASKNRRSDFDAALAEFKHVRKRVEDEIGGDNAEYRRQYTLIWLDAILNIARIHREKYQIIISKEETLFIFYRFKNILQKDKTLREDFLELVDATSKLVKNEYEDTDLLETQQKEPDLPCLDTKSFNKLNDLNSYDKKRYFLLVLLDMSQNWRYVHSVDNYLMAVYTAIIADQWSKKMDVGVAPGHNIDALNIISSALRKYIKFEYEKSKINELLKEITITIDTEKQSLVLRSDGGFKDNRAASLKSFVKKLYDYANEGHLNSKIEVIKWYCLYRQNPGLLSCIREEVKYKRIQSFFNKGNQDGDQNIEQNIQLRFLQGLVYFRRGEYQQAINVLEELTDKKNKMTQYIRLGTIGLKARYILADCYMSLARYREAEIILKLLYDSLETVRKINKGQNDGTDAAIEPRVEIDLAYCYMQRGAYKSAFEIYKELYSKDGTDVIEFDSKQVKRERRIMGLNNYAACSIFSINDEPDSIKFKIETARKIFNYMDETFGADRDDPETNLLKGYYTLCVGIEPRESLISDEQVEKCRHITEPEYAYYRNNAIIKAHEYFKNACRFEMGFKERYVFQREGTTKDVARSRNEVERISAYIINLIKLYGMENKHDNNNQYKRDIQRFILGFPTNYEISLKAAIALAEWLLTYEEMNQETEKGKSIEQMYRSFSYVTIYEERGVHVFNLLQENEKFRFFTTDQRGKFFALLLAMYKPIKAIKEECCFNLEDKKSTPHLVHYTSIGSLKKIFANKNLSAPKFRINNCGYMNDVFEGNILLNCIKLVAQNEQYCESQNYSEFIKKYFPQIDRPHEDMLPSGSDVYIGSMSVKEDSFPLWSIYAENECGCNIEFGDDFFDINGIPYYPNALRDYMLSKYTDKDYPLYIVQYIGSKFKKLYSKNNKSQMDNVENKDVEGNAHACGTRAIEYGHLYSLLQQIYKRWKGLDEYLSKPKFKDVVNDSKEVIYAFAADRINEIRFLFKDEDYEFEGEVRIVYTDYTDKSIVDTSTEQDVPCVYVDMEREIKDVSVRLGSRIEDATVDKYVTWLKHTNFVKKVDLSKRNRYIHQTKVKDLL